MRRLRGAGIAECIAAAGLVLALATMAVPRLPRGHDRETTLRKDLTICRAAIQVFYDDTKHFPASLDDLAAKTAPSSGLDDQGEEVPITNWHGPYLSSVPQDPISRQSLSYSTAASHVGVVRSSASGDSGAGSPYASW
jgi:type II secretory pathway pseudopilin PulG